MALAAVFRRHEPDVLPYRADARIDVVASRWESCCRTMQSSINNQIQFHLRLV